MDLIRNLRFLINNYKSKKKIIFIIGSPRSGTTLLKTIMITHSQIGSCKYESTGLFKLRDFSKFSIYGIEDNITHSIKSRSPSLIKFYENISYHFLSEQGKTIFLDKLWPSKIRLKYVKNKFPNAVFIHIVRDGRDCYCSALKHPNIPQNKSIKIFSKYWNHSVKMIQSELANNNLITIKYEDLATSPENTIKEVFKKLELNFEKEIITHDKYSKNAFMGHRSYHRKLTNKIDSSSLNRWKSELNDREKEIFKKYAFKQLLNFGYL